MVQVISCAANISPAGQLSGRRRRGHVVTMHQRRCVTANACSSWELQWLIFLMGSFVVLPGWPYNGRRQCHAQRKRRGVAVLQVVDNPIVFPDRFQYLLLCRLAIGREEAMPGAKEAPESLGGVAALQVKGNFMFDPANHRDFLGAILGTGIVREKVRNGKFSLTFLSLLPKIHIAFFSRLCMHICHHSATSHRNTTLISIYFAAASLRLAIFWCKARWAPKF